MCKNLTPNPINDRLLSQAVGSAGSVGANYREANGASSKKDFQNKIFICKKESKETLYWIELIEKNIMRIQNIAQYQSLDNKSRISREKPRIDVVSKDPPKDTYESSQSVVREDLLNTIKKRISAGFYNTEIVLEDLSDSFAKALNQTT